MAGDWIAMRCDLHEDPAVIAIAAGTGLDEFAVVGRLHRVWAWFDQQSQKGRVAVTHDFINRIASCDIFFQKLVEVGWLKVRSDNTVEIPKFGRWGGESGKRRALATRRKRRERGAQTSRAQRDNTVTTGQYRTGPDSTGPDSTGETGSKNPGNRFRGAGVSAKRNGKRNGTKSIFSGLSADDLCDTGTLIGWVGWASTQSKSPISRSEQDLLRVVAAAERALEIGDNPPALFASIVGRREWDLISQDQEERARKRLREHQKGEVSK